MKTAEEILDENVSFRDKVKEEFVLRAMEEYASQFQPKWIKINSEADLPTEKGDYWIANENGVFDFIASRERVEVKFKNNTCTHYMPVIKPQPPKED